MTGTVATTRARLKAIHPAAWSSAAFYAAYFSIAGVHVPFWSVFLQSRGVGPAEIGVLFGVGLVLRPVTGPLFGYWADRFFGLRAVLQMMAVAIFVGFALFIPLHGFWPLLVATVVIMTFHASIVPMADALTLQHQSCGHLSFSRVRLWGSLSFLSVNILAGLILSRFGADGILAAVLFFAAGLVVASCFLRAPQMGGVPAQVSLRGLWRLASQPELLLVLIAGSLINAAHVTYYAFGSLAWKAQGIPTEIIGALWSVGVIAEVGLLWFAGRWTNGRSGLWLIAIGGLAAALRWTAMALDPPLWCVFGLQVLHALTFGATMVGAMTYIARSVEPSYAGSVQGIYGALSGGLFMATGGFLAGWLYEIAPFWAYIGMAVAGAFGAGLVGLIILRPKGRVETA